MGGGKAIQNTQVFDTSGQGEISEKFDLKVWKSTYEPTNAAMSKFWKNYDREGWSIWTCTYDYAEDNEDLESTKNIVTEFMVKTKPIESECFGVMHVCGKLEIEGIWLFKGSDPENL